MQALKEEDAQVQKQQQDIAALNEKLATVGNDKKVIAALRDKVEELTTKVNSLDIQKQELEAQNAKLSELENKLIVLQSNIAACCQAINNRSHTDDGDVTVKSTLDQNVPNPFNTETRISFKIVGNYQSAFIGVYNLNGEQIRKIAVQEGMNSVTVSAGELMPGMYVYNLVVDNNLIDAKKMVIVD